MNGVVEEELEDVQEDEVQLVDASSLHAQVHERRHVEYLVAVLCPLELM